ncbi:putative P2Y purinoceptor 10 [Acanthochromis polyacanthus]|uniref:putative P2Y purinoceptor 10 n=1 Tax=Acanthochromis polyacanthus TaxID=80966 RepID=UPI000B8F0CEA|nr:putative P2Y purinoceptor 10 [Acanthochromis polyacanthus]
MRETMNPLNTSGRLDQLPPDSSSSGCNDNLNSWEEAMNKMYTYFYLLLFIPGLLLNTTALWVLCRHISKRTKAVIFMINLALADLVHILSLPLRIYYYFTHSWPFGPYVCMFCFYLKYLNMYASIVFLVCISMQRCVFLLDPFAARRWRRRYDLLISLVVWVVVGLACSPFILMRSGSNSSSLNSASNMSDSLDATPTHVPLVFTKFFEQTLSTIPSKLTTSDSPTASKPTCFKDLPTRHVSLPQAISIIAFAQLFGFLIPLACILYSSIRITQSLNQKQAQDQQNSLNPSARNRLQSVNSTCQSNKYHVKQTNSEKRRALRMVLSCCSLFLLCFAPYHLNFLLYMMVQQDIVSHCATRVAVQQFHPVSLCLASMSCCLNPLLYYFLTAEFRMHLSRRTSSFSSSLLSSPVNSPKQSSLPHRLMSMESSCSDRE